MQPCPPRSLPLGFSHPVEDLPLGPSHQALSEPSISRQPQKSQARTLGLKVQALEKTVTSRERVVTEAARALQATAQAVLHKTEPLMQVGSCPLRQHLEKVGAAPGMIWAQGLQGEGRAKTRSSSFHPSSAFPQIPENLS